MATNKHDYEIINKNKEAGNKLRVAVYTRVSTNDQFMNGAGIDAQCDAIDKEIKDNKSLYEYNKKLNYYEDGAHSGASEHRPALDRLIEDIYNGDIDIIIVYKIDRLFRKLLYLLQFIHEISKKGVYIKSIKDNIDTSDKMGMVMLQFMGIIGDIERDNIRLRTIDGKITKAKKGYYVGGGKTPFGFDLHSTPGGKKLSINHDEAKVVNRIFDMYVNKNKTLGDIAKTLTMEGIPTRDDRLKLKTEKENLNRRKHIEKNININEDDDTEFDYEAEIESSAMKGTKKENDGLWYGSSVRKILNNRIYIGEYEYGKTTKEWNEVTKKYEIIKNAPDKIITFKCDKILEDVSLYDEAQEILAKNLVRKTKTNYLFSGLIKCEMCGMSYNGYKSSKGTYHYRCKGGMTSGNLKVRCRNPEISEDILFKYSWAELDRNLSNPENFKAVIFDEEKNKEIISDLNKRISSVMTLIKTKNNNLEVAVTNEMETDNKTKKAIYQKRINEYEEDIVKLELEKEELSREISIIKSNEKKKDDIKNFYEEHERAMNNLTEERKRDLIKKYVKVIYKSLGKLKFRFNIIDDLEGKDWRDGEEGEDKKLKSTHDLFDIKSINMRDVKRTIRKK